MSRSQIPRSWLRQAALAARESVHGPGDAAARPPGLGSRPASSSSRGCGGSGGGTAGNAKERAAAYLQRKAAAGQPGADAPRSRLAEAAAEFSEAQQAFMLSSPSGLGVGAEAAIAQAIKEGALDNLEGKGKPLGQQGDHGAQFFSVDPLVQAVTRTMGLQNVRPLSLELREELQRELAAMRGRLAEEVRAALAAEAGHQKPAAEGSRAKSSGWFGGSFGRASGAQQQQQRRRQQQQQQQSMAAIRAGEHPALQHAAERVRQLTREYNSAVLSDKETLGPHWPLDQAKQLDWGQEVAAAEAAAKSGMSRHGDAAAAAPGGKALSTLSAKS